MNVRHDQENSESVAEIVEEIAEVIAESCVMAVATAATTIVIPALARALARARLFVMTQGSARADTYHEEQRQCVQGLRQRKVQQVAAGLSNDNAGSQRHRR